ncbi:MAG TPA: hypothetical protein VJS37_16685 [Terriglobales bacterium]|nr:hypothetical protein [Terriglobales bacterium]
MTVHPYSRLLLAAAILSASCLVVAQPRSNQLSPTELIKEVIYNELHPSPVSCVHWRYRLLKQVDGKQETKAVVETKSGSLDRLLMVAGKPLSPEQENAEEKRILRFARSTAEQRKAEQSREKDAQESDALLQKIPDAFVFKYAGENGTAVRVTFTPNPQFRPSTREDKVLQQMAGEMWVDSSQKRLISMSGQLMDEVKFGGGVLGHLEKGGQFRVERKEVSKGDWELTQLVVDMHGKALMFKSISVQQKEIHSNFERVSNELTFPDAANLLLQQTFVASSQQPR